MLTTKVFIIIILLLLLLLLLLVNKDIGRIYIAKYRLLRDTIARNIGTSAIVVCSGAAVELESTFSTLRTTFAEVATRCNYLTIGAACVFGPLHLSPVKAAFPFCDWVNH